VSRFHLMRWTQRLKEVLNLDVETCPNYGGPAKVIASIEDPPACGVGVHLPSAFHDGFATDLGICVPRDYLVAAGTRR